MNTPASPPTPIGAMPAACGIGGSPRRHSLPTSPGVTSKASAPAIRPHLPFAVPFEFPPAPPLVGHVPAPATSGGLSVLRQLILQSSSEVLRDLLFSGDPASNKLLEIAYSCPPHLHPDLPNVPLEAFIKARQACNKEMMRRCVSLCTASTRSAMVSDPDSHVPYILKTQPRRNLQRVVQYIPLHVDSGSFGVFETWLSMHSPWNNKDKKDNVSDMVSKIAASIADEGQALAETTNALNGAPAPSASDILALAPGGLKKAFKFTLEQLRKTKHEKLHTGRNCKSIDWALEDVGIQDLQGEDLKKFELYRKALDELAFPRTGNSNKKPTKIKDEVLTEFKKLVSALGVSFKQDRVPDIIQLLAAAQLTCGSA